MFLFWIFSYKFATALFGKENIDTETQNGCPPKTHMHSVFGT